MNKPSGPPPVAADPGFDRWLYLFWEFTVGGTPAVTNNITVNPTTVIANETFGRQPAPFPSLTRMGNSQDILEIESFAARRNTSVTLSNMGNGSTILENQIFGP